MFNRCKSRARPDRAPVGPAPFSFSRFILAVFWFLSLPSSLYAWGEAGHRIIADVADRRLNEQARHEIQALLGGASPASVAGWADRIRGERPETAPWHFVNLPFKASRYDPKRDCASPSAGDCVIAAIVRFRTVLADRARPAAERAEALKFLIHLIADLHQPLHAVNRNDRGGNDVEVRFFGEALNAASGKPWSLHAVWDAGLIERTGLSEPAYVARLEGWIKKRKGTGLQRGTVVDWALEAHRAAVRVAYRLPKNRNLSKDYFEKSLPAMDALLAKGGVRLARVLNETLAGRQQGGRER